jgi:hypothetical protein
MLFVWCLILIMWFVVLDSISTDFRLRKQRFVLQKIRTELLAWKMPADLSENLWEKYESWNAVAAVMYAGTAIVCLGDASRGNYSLVTRHIIRLILFFSSNQLQERKYILYYFRFMGLTQTYDIWCMGKQNIKYAERALLVRAVLLGFSTENLDEIFCSLVPFALVTGRYWQVFSVVLFFIFPMELFGIRNLVASKLQVNQFSGATSGSFLSIGSASKSLSLLITLIPGMTMIYSYQAAVPVRVGSLPFLFGSTTSMMFFAASLFVWFRKDWIDNSIQPAFVNYHKSVRSSATQLNVDYANFTMNVRHMKTVLHFVWVGTAIVAALSGYSTLLVFGIYGGGWVLLLFGIHRYNTDKLQSQAESSVSKYLSEPSVHQKVMLNLHLLLLFVGFDPRSGINISVLLTLLRSLMQFSCSGTFSMILTEILWNSAIHLLVISLKSQAQESELTSVYEFDVIKAHILISFSSTLVTLANILLQENTFHMWEASRKGENFLDHAVKQKFSGVGSAIGTIISSACTVVDNNSVLMSLLTQAIQECHIGNDICHMSACVRKHTLNLYSMNNSYYQPIPLSDILSDWETTNSFGAFNYDREVTSGYFVHVNADLLRTLLSRMCRTPSRCCLDVQLQLVDWPGQFRLEFSFRHVEEKPTSEGNLIDYGSLSSSSQIKFLRILLSNVASIFGATIDENRLLLPCWKTRQDSGTPLEQPAYLSPLPKLRFLAPSVVVSSAPSPAKPQNTIRIGTAVPPNLTVAILDDNNLVRKSTLRLVLQYTLANKETSFACGQTYQEALFFPHQITAQNVDIAIFDQILDYEGVEEDVSGTALAILARKRGFSGCMLLHSANAELSSSLSPVFDGYIEKTSKRAEFINTLAKHWNTYQLKKNSVGNVRSNE